MINLVDFDISIKEQMERIRLKYNEDINAKTFASGYIWAKPMNIKVHLETDMYAMKNNSHGQTAWNFPVGEEKAKINLINKLVHIEGLKLLKLTSDDVAFLDKNYSNVFAFKEASDASEYIYDAVEHADMSGKKFGGLRRLLNKFNRQHSVKTVMLTGHNMQAAEDIITAWNEAHNARGELNTSGTEIDRFVIDHYDEIGMIGALVYVDSVPSAVTMGYPISSDVCDIAETKFVPTIKDIGYVAFEEFIKMFGSTYRYFNNEEDMGIPGLREYKQCLKPCRMNVLYDAHLKGVRAE